jgi:hypothetical protein
MATMSSETAWPVYILAALAVLMVGFLGIVLLKNRRFREGDVFKASRLTRGNRIFPTQVAITPTSVVQYKAQLFGHQEQSIHTGHVASVTIDTGLLFSDVIFETSGGSEPIVCHGHRKADAVRMKELVERYQVAQPPGCGRGSRHCWRRGFRPRLPLLRGDDQGRSEGLPILRSGEPEGRAPSLSLVQPTDDAPFLEGSCSSAIRLSVSAMARQQSRMPQAPKRTGLRGSRRRFVGGREPMSLSAKALQLELRDVPRQLHLVCANVLEACRTEIATLRQRDSLWRPFVSDLPFGHAGTSCTIYTRVFVGQ